jgi:hypothetical protein
MLISEYSSSKGTPPPPDFVKTLESADAFFEDCKDLIPDGLFLKIGK